MARDRNPVDDRLLVGRISRPLVEVDRSRKGRQQDKLRERDVGALVGEWLHRAVTAMSVGNEDEVLLDTTLTHQQVLAAGVAAIERFRPVIAALWSGYLTVRSDVDAGFAAECAAFAGWHLLERMLAAAEHRPVLGAVERAGAGIGRTLLSAPDRFVDVLGLA